MAYSNSPTDVLGDYANIRTVPALISVFFALASLYQFGGINAGTTGIYLEWLDYSLTTQHAVFISLGSFVVAFASSETKSFERYEQWEQGLIAAGPALILAHQYVPAVTNFISSNGALAGAGAFLVTIASWGVAIR